MLPSKCAFSSPHSSESPLVTSAHKCFFCKDGSSDMLGRDQLYSASTSSFLLQISKLQCPNPRCLWHWNAVFLVKLPTSVFSPWSLDPWILKEILWICKYSYSFFTCEMPAHLPRPPDCRIMQQKYIGPNPIRDSVARGRYPSLHVRRDPLNSGNVYLWKAILNYTKLHSKHIDN